MWYGREPYANDENTLALIVQAYTSDVIKQAKQEERERIVNKLERFISTP